MSFLVPMGQEMTYRYQEGLITEALAVLRGFLERCAQSDPFEPSARAAQ